jgi:hypothetical protein
MRKLAAVASAVIVLAAPFAASADPTSAQCIAANEHATDLRQEAKLREARAEMLTCAVATCPARVRDDCAKQIAAIDAAMPTVVFEVKDPAGNDVADVRVTVDGALAAERLGGSPLSLDPGEHVVRFERSGATPVEKSIVVHEGEKDRPVGVVVGESAHGQTVGTPGPGSPALPPPAPGSTVETSGSWSGRRTLAWVTGGVGVAGLGVATGFGFAAKSSWNRSQADCTSPTSCTNHAQAVDERQAALTFATVSDVVFVASCTAVVAATVLLLTGSPPASSTSRPSAGAPSWSAELTPEIAPHTAALAVGGRF